MIKRVAVIAILLLVGRYYYWTVMASGYAPSWGLDLPGYYDYLGRAFASGHLYVPIDPAQYQMHDMALYHGRYYLYHGAAPAVLLFAPYRLATGHDLPEHFAQFVFCFGGFLFLALALLRVLRLARVESGPGTLALLLLMLGLCTGVPYLLARVWVYEIAIACGFCCTAAGVFFLAGGVASRWRAAWWATSGLCFGLAIASRPHLGLAALVTFAALLYYRTSWRSLIAFATPLAAVGAALAIYNFARFGNPLEFGLHHLITGPGLNRIKLAARFVPLGFRYFLLEPPAASPVFPWFSPASRPVTLPPGYFLEATAGAFWLAPLAGAFLLAIPRGFRFPVAAAGAASAGIALFLISTGFTTQRYTVDFLPLAVLALAAGFALSSPGRLRLAAFAFAMVCTAIVNMAFGICGSYNELARNRPKRYVRLASYFSPVERYRPLLNPGFTFNFDGPLPDGRVELLTLDHPAYRCVFGAERRDGKLRITSETASGTLGKDLPDPGASTQNIGIRYRANTVEISLGGSVVLQQPLANLVVAPSQVIAIERAQFNFD
ncbi:MAG: hypothetical protein ABI759_27535 [Candidatus Solibacter sp.]